MPVKTFQLNQPTVMKITFDTTVVHQTLPGQTALVSYKEWYEETRDPEDDVTIQIFQDNIEFIPLFIGDLDGRETITFVQKDIV